MKITDLLQDYEELTIQLSPVEEISVKRVKELVHKQLPRRKRGKTVLLIAAVLALLGVTACAVGMSLWDRAKADLGLAPDKTLPEYVEYDLETPADGIPTVSLVSALWTNTESTIYLSVNNPMIEMMPTRQEYPWSIGTISFSPSDAQLTGCWIEQVAYDEQENTVLLRCNLSVKNLGEAETCSFRLRWTPSYRVNNGTTLDIGIVTVEVPELRQLRATVNAPYKNPYLDVEGTVLAFDIYANSFRVTMEVPTFDKVCEALGEDAHGTIAEAYWNTWKDEPSDPSDFDVTDAWLAYDRSWREPWDDFAICYKDGSMVYFEDLAYEVTPIYEETNGLSFGYEFSRLQELDQLKSVYYHGTEYLLEPVE